MGWIQEQFERRMHSDQRNASAQNTAEISFEALADLKWKELVTGLKRDVDEYRSLGGDVILREDSDLACRITNPTPGVTALVIADPAAHTIQYTFESEAGETAVPEGGFFSLRRASSNGIDLYSADQRISIEQATRMVLEPLLFPSPRRVM
jgi:hypothetical protein